jgi:hypothetical protein
MNQTLVFYAYRSYCRILWYGRLTHYLICVFLQTDEELDPEDVEFDEHYTIETRSKCKAQLPGFVSFRSLRHKYSISSNDSSSHIFSHESQ